MENKDIILSQEELYMEVASRTKINEKEVKKVLESFIDLFLKKLRLN